MTAEREERRKQTVALLLDAPERRFAAFAGQPTETGVPVMIAVISRTHSILTGELNAPANACDSATIDRRTTSARATECGQNP